MKEIVLTNKRAGFLHLSTRDLLVTIVFISIFTMAVRVPLDTDTWWHLRTGQYILENQTIPVTDPFSHSKAGQPWIDHSWLAQIFWYGLYVVGGWGVVALGVAGLAALTFWFVWKQIEGNVFVASLAMILGAVTSAVIWVARPQMITLLLTAIVAYLLNRFKRRNGKLLPWLPLVMVGWANIHGGFAVGFMLIVTYLVGEVVNHLTRHQDDPVLGWPQLKNLGIVTLISLAVVVINPHTWRMWVYPFQTVGIGALRDFIQEWQSPDFHQAHAQPFVVMLLLVIAAMARSGRRADWTDLALIAMWTVWSLFAGRNIAIFGVVGTPILARYADLAWSRQWQTWEYHHVPFSTTSTGSSSGGLKSLRVTLNWVLLILVTSAALIKISLPLSRETNLRIERSTMPYEAVEFIREQRPAGPMLNSYNWGGYLIFKLWPDYPVYIDGRTDLYDDRFIRRYLSVVAAQDGWEQILSDDRINLVLIEHDSALAKFLRRDSNWSEIYQDEMAAIFSRKTTLTP